MQDMTAIVDTINIKSLFTVEFWYHSGEAGGSSAGINWETIIFIFGMMVMVEGMARVGVTVILFLAAVTIELAQVLKFNPIPMILSEIFCANLGGSATMCGDPPNIIIGTSLGYSFMDFVTNTGVIAGISFVAIVVYFYVVFKKELLANASKNVDYESLPTPEATITDKRGFYVSGVIFLVAILLLITHAQTGLTVASIGMIVAIVTLLTSGRHAKLLLKKVDYKTITFLSVCLW